MIKRVISKSGSISETGKRVEEALLPARHEVVAQIGDRLCEKRMSPAFFKIASGVTE